MRLNRSIKYSLTALMAAITLQSSFAANPAMDFPSKPIRMIVGQQAGSALDNSVRTITPAFGEALGAQIVIDNRPGVGGMIAMQLGHASIPDGYTIVNAGSPQMIAPFLYKKLDYDLFSDFVAIARLTTVQNCLVTNPGFTPNTVRQLIDLVKAKPGQLNMASAGVGSASHLAGILFSVMTDAPALHVPYKGGASAVTALISNEAQFMITPLSATIAHIKARRLKVLGTGGSTRSPQLPDIPTIQEAGVKGFISVGWNGLFARTGTPATAVNRLVNALTSVMAKADMQERIFRAGVEPGLIAGEEFKKFMREDMIRFGLAVKAANLKAQ
ncbi:MAG: Bug family tripartite tricarboxylate transporter substrate binding protein [Burkholderiales bacterium]